MTAVRRKRRGDWELESFANLPLVEACAPDAHAELELVEVVQILCRRVRSLERQLAEARR